MALIGSNESMPTVASFILPSGSIKKLQGTPTVRKILITPNGVWHIALLEKHRVVHFLVCSKLFHDLRGRRFLLTSCHDYYRSDYDCRNGNHRPNHCSSGVVKMKGILSNQQPYRLYGMPAWQFILLCWSPQRCHSQFAVGERRISILRW